MNEEEEAQEVDWTILEEEGFEDVLKIVARKVARIYGQVLMMDRDDAEQELRIILALNATEARDELAEYGRAGLNRWLWQHAAQEFRAPYNRETEVVDEDENGREIRRPKSISYDKLAEDYVGADL